MALEKTVSLGSSLSMRLDDRVEVVHANSASFRTAVRESMAGRQVQLFLCEFRDPPTSFSESNPS